MSPIDERWSELSDKTLAAFAKGWLAELDGDTNAREAFGLKDDDGDIGLLVTQMNFTAVPEVQWRFLQHVIQFAETDDHLGHIAAGPIEHLLGWYGDAYIDAVERWAAEDAKFARAMTGVWKYKMSDANWTRVKAIQARFVQPPGSAKQGDQSPTE